LEVSNKNVITFLPVITKWKQTNYRKRPTTRCSGQPF